MFTKLFNKNPQQSDNPPQDDSLLNDFEPRVVVHYGIPSTASILAFDPLQHLLAIGTLDGRIKVIGGDNIECLLISPVSAPFKHLEFLQNQGFLVSVSNENLVQVWDLEQRRLASNLQWESNISAFSVAFGTNYMYVGDEYGYFSVLKYDFEEGNIQHMPYQIPADIIADEAGIPVPDQLSIVGLLPQPCSSGKRVLIAYQNGVIILWDVNEDKAVLVRSPKDMQIKDEIIIPSASDIRRESLNTNTDDEPAEKEISALCWVSSDGSMLAVGYLDGDIILWNLPTEIAIKDQKANKSSNNAVKLKLSSGDKRLPVIVLRWSNGPHSITGGQLFVYGGDDLGSEEALTVLNLESSSGLETLKCVKRLDLTLNGYADIELIPNVGSTESSFSTLFVLTNPGQLHVYNNEFLSGLISAPDMKHAVNSVQCPVTLPTVEPYMTVAKLCLVDKDEGLQTILKKTVSASKPQLASPKTTGSPKWPVIGGFSSQINAAENIGVERIYIAGYQDGYVRIWDSTSPVFTLISVLGFQVEGTEVPGASDPISALDYYSTTSSLAVGNDRGLVHLLKFVGESENSNVHFVTEAKREEVVLNHGNGWQSTAIFSLINSPVRSLQYTFSGARVIVGHECGKAAVLDIESSSVLFLTDCLVSSSSPVVSLAMKTYIHTDTDDDHEQSGDASSSDPEKEVAFMLTEDAHVILVDSSSGNKICSRSVNPKESSAISIYLLDEKFSARELSEQNTVNSSQDSTDGKESLQSPTEPVSDSTEADVSSLSEATELWKNFVDSVILVCCEDSMFVYSTKSLIQGEPNFIHKIDLEKRCCWTTIFKKNGVESGMVIVYSTGDVEIRSLPDLRVQAETSIMSILRWNFKSKMEKTISSFGNGHISMVYGCEFAVISLFSSENDFRIPEALPRLHDKVVAEAAEAALKFSLSQKSKQTAPTGIIGGIIKGIRREKENDSTLMDETRDVLVPKLEALFSRSPFSVSDLDLNLGDDFDAPTGPIKLVVEKIEVEPTSPEPPSPNQSQLEKNDKTERDRLFEGGSAIAEPKSRTADEIKAKYRKTGTGDTAAVAIEAKDKLLERQMKLEKLKENSEELASGSENFADLAGQLKKQMENRRWWQL
ncbi:transducin family protein / WD-40 repeat family protein [Artemisia annua]|uniref:Transducin family protein / WD-40 repeat family protein n=1 Tax=Artemisia annua TaxID=35608 RepID=A0A2U1PI35_ARTAN|nr:transducin family protein / WD-40 repeat family protein [Artemisia annua]